MTQSRQSFNTVAIVDDILARGAQCRASDIHFEPGVGQMSIKFRLDGCLQTVEQLPAAISENIITRLKVMASLLTYRNDIPQEGRIELAADNTDMIEQRISTFPTIHGQRAVVRLFYCDTGLDHLNELGLPVALALELQKLVSQNQGVLLLTGPAGSGKTTTLAALLRYIQSEFPGKSIVTLEDPVERHIEGVTQIQISQNSELTFPRALRSLLRQDPQVLMVGEIRDSETAKIVIEAGLSGHLLLSTMHSGSPAGAFMRLLEMGIEPYQITSAVMAVLNQRLLRKLCLDCRQESAGGYTAVGCDKCLQTGYKGRVLIAELVELDTQLRQGILSRADAETLAEIINARGHVTLEQNTLRLVREGIVSQ